MWEENANTGSAVAGGADMPDMDALFEQAVNHEDVTRTQSDALKPTGTYTTVPTLRVDGSRVKEGPNAGRLMIRFFGGAALTVTEKTTKAMRLPVGSEVKGSFGFGISPERRNKIRNGVDTGEPDNASKLWAQAVKVYEATYKQKANTIGEVVNFVQNYPVNLRVIQVGVPTDQNPEPDGEPGNIVMNISQVRVEG